jgi:hypothetical protein
MNTRRAAADAAHMATPITPKNGCKGTVRETIAFLTQRFPKLSREEA